ncbi:MAG: twin-arginine translocase TatA/TatE family subunit [Candidatus Nitrosopelagicus sp.]|jgi:sec-independent protein translocase protein TatA|nr:twin-arginine translocase TatA/TatE family subunit [Candidatus Nitrosopelagicus sp.]MBT4454955.1 twin-arginine translocase TatA/TatE family subunit [Candidatus Nitrosopelagicus sp.]MBT5171348.1 twin-arginine translocase TatA/TatE family subunit [Candidatus Nitrosopelagicus sp.]MBT7252201.1 twin-arginine translocase TatA/TatE family subunit [Candidatus Nitrosopelagicus sp.]|tara:strand:- start:666 stop:1034 length:369 start_codon:yes stop_codon:yes gene_type:complete
MEYFLNIMGSEWMIIIFAALILLFGTNKLPEAGKKIGKMVGEYNKAKTEMQNQINDMAKTEPDNPTIDGPVQTERQKLEKMAQTLRINIENKSDVELKNAIDAKFGSQESSSKNITDNKFKN